MRRICVRSLAATVCIVRPLFTATAGQQLQTAGQFVVSEEDSRIFAQLSEALFTDESRKLSIELPASDLMEEDTGEVLPSAKYTDATALTTPHNLDSGKNVAVSGNTPAGDVSQPISAANTTPLARAVQELSHCAPEHYSTTLSTALSALMASEPSLSNRAASELLVTGADLRAILPDGAMRHLEIRNKCLTRCDFSTVSLLSVSAACVDFSRSLFYAAAFHNCVFVDCCFDGCVLKELRCLGNVRFERCSFCFAAIALRGIHKSSHTLCAQPRAAGNRTTRRWDGGTVVFDRCDFDLSDFDGSEYIPACSFIDCTNTHLAAKFPPRTGASSRSHCD
uniref:Uncharacterized protein n=1 Tax=Trypanosoma vivax (strain Y486) TaxID=1055687 RepID=G0TXS5_TRYVY|nr:conserved hypothetical protein [Trypanosoma vivax Y486]